MHRPVLRYHGGKWRIAPWIIDQMPAHRVYVEPYCGAASVLMRKPRSHVEVINDLDHHVVDLFRVLRSPEMAAELLHKITLTPYARAEWELAWDGTTGDPIEDARRYIVRSWASHGSSKCTTKSSTGFRRCAVRRNHGSHPAQDFARWPVAMAEVTERLRGVVIEHRDALNVIAEYDSDKTLFYVDPPYLLTTRSRPDHGYQHEMDDQAHEDLAAALHACAGMVLLSGYRSELYDELYGGWERIDRQTQVDGGRLAGESLWLSPCASRHRGRQCLLFTDMEV